jgi:hypothetical protein
MPIQCKNTDKLGKVLEKDFTLDTSSIDVNKYTNSNGLVVNIFTTTGNVNFQGKVSEDCNMKETIIKKIDAINELEQPLGCDKKEN